jgi:hypothetical protein
MNLFTLEMLRCSQSLFTVNIPPLTILHPLQPPWVLLVHFLSLNCYFLTSFLINEQFLTFVGEE